MWSERRRRLIAVLALCCGVAALACIMFFTSGGQVVTDHAKLQALLGRYPTAAPLLFVGIYVGVGCTMLPLWPLQGVAGFVFGPVWAVVYCQGGNAMAAYLTTAFSKMLVVGVPMAKLDPVLARLRQVQRRLGSTGVPLVMATRLAHVTPFGPCNVAFGILRLRPRDVAIGTLLGNNGSVGFYAILGAAGVTLRQDWPAMLTLMAALATLNLALAAPLAWRYWRGRDAVVVASRP